jgi:hypothetical protein
MRGAAGAAAWTFVGIERPTWPPTDRFASDRDKSSGKAPPPPPVPTDLSRDKSVRACLPPAGALPRQPRQARPDYDRPACGKPLDLRLRRRSRDRAWLHWSPADPVRGARPETGPEPALGECPCHQTSDPRHAPRPPRHWSQTDRPLRPLRLPDPIRRPKAVPSKRPIRRTSAQRQLPRPPRQQGPADRQARRWRLTDPLPRTKQESRAKSFRNNTFARRPNRTTPAKHTLNNHFSSVNRFQFINQFQLLKPRITRDTPPSSAPPAGRPHPKSAWT